MGKGNSSDRLLSHPTSLRQKSSDGMRTRYASRIAALAEKIAHAGHPRPPPSKEISRLSLHQLSRGGSSPHRQPTDGSSSTPRMHPAAASRVHFETVILSSCCLSLLWLSVYVMLGPVRGSSPAAGIPRGGYGGSVKCKPFLLAANGSSGFGACRMKSEYYR